VAPDADPKAADQPSHEQLARTGLSHEQPFVGRESELRQLGAAFEAVAASGDGRLILLVGEPGIGKTALCQQLSSFVSARNGRILVGHCYPEGSAGVPYQPFVEAFEAFARQRDAEALRAELGPNASDVARMVPALRNRLQVKLSTPENPEDDRLRLLSGILDCLRNIGAAQPLLLVLEDLHDADRGTLDLLVYVARHLAGTPLLLVGTYRDVEVDRAHPLAAALAELRRGSQFERVHLSELSVDEVQRLLASSSQQAVPRALAEQVHHRSGGNALFVHELLRFLLSEGLVERRGGVLRRVGEETSLAGHMPEGLRDVVGKRLSRLSPAANQVLRVASVIGREFQLEVLRRVHARPDEELESALEEAVAEAIVDEQLVVGATITYRFTHAFFQQTLSDEIMAPRRIRLHQQVARVLEEVFSNARRLEEHAAELAEHYSFSSDANDLSKAVDYATLAAKRATEVFAYGEAARKLERALAVQDLVDPEDGQSRCDLLLDLGEVLLPAGETERVIAHIAPEALALAETLGDRSREFRACRLALEGFFAQGYRSGTARPEYLIWAERAGSCADPDGVEHVYADLARAHALDVRSRWPDARALRLEALALARRLDDPETLFRSAYDLRLAPDPEHWAEGVRLTEEATRWPRLGVSGRTLGWLLSIAGLLQLAEGERAEAEELWRQLEELADRTHVVTVRLCVLQRDAVLAIVDGHLQEALALLKQLVEYADESGASVRGRDAVLLFLVAPVLYLGQAEKWLATFDEYTRLIPQASQAYSAFAATRAVCLAHLGRLEEALTVIGPQLDEIDSEAGADERPVPTLVMLLQAAVLLRHRAAAAGLGARLACVAHLAISVGTGSSCIARHLGDAAALAGDRVAARAYYRQALEAAGRIQFRPELALTHLRLAELLLERGDAHAQSEALEHLDVAIPELQDMHMRPGLERGLALREKLTPPAAPETARQSVSDTLTAREREIATLVADGLSNRDIAEKLVISEGTVDVHVKHILGKLEFRSRTQVAGWFARQGRG
jgi:DNA-binding CsgD family transcriptional regulator